MDPMEASDVGGVEWYGASIDAALQAEVEEYFDAGARVQRGDVVVDVGANVGAFAARVAERTSGEVTLHCFEPAPDTFAALERNGQVHRWLRRARLRLARVALTSPAHAGRERPFYFFARIPTNSTYHLEDKHAEYVTYFHARAAEVARGLARIPALGRVLVRLVDAFVGRVVRADNSWFVGLADRASGLRVLPCRTESLERWARRAGVTRVDLLKVDVEGAELDVLLGAGALWPAIQQVVVEAHERGGRLEAITRLLAEQGFVEVARVRPKMTAEAGLDNVILVARRPN